MLVLSRKLGESICIGDNIIVSISQISHGRVRLGIEAPRAVNVCREELRREPPPVAPVTTASSARSTLRS